MSTLAIKNMADFQWHNFARGDDKNIKNNLIFKPNMETPLSFIKYMTH